MGIDVRLNPDSGASLFWKGPILGHTLLGNCRFRGIALLERANFGASKSSMNGGLVAAA